MDLIIIGTIAILGLLDGALERLTGAGIIDRCARWMDE